MTFQDLSDKLNSTVQTVPNVVKVLSNAFADMEGAGGGVDYSADEQDTGLKWIDDKPVYELTIHVENTTETFADYVTVASVTDGIGTLIDLRGTAKRVINDGVFWYEAPSRPEQGVSYQYSIGLRATANDIQYRIDGYGAEITDLYITVRYTKAA